MNTPATTAPAVFQFQHHAVRAIDIHGEPWFVAADVAEALDYRMASDLTRFLDDDEKGTQIVRTPSGDQMMTIINESGLYSAILRSRKPEAKQFKKWVTSEVLPAIRKTGRYQAPTTKYITPDQVNQIRLAVRDRINNTGENHATVYNELFRSLGACSTNGILQAQFNHAIHQVNSYRRPARPEELVQAVVERSRFVVQYVDGKPRVNIIPADCWIITEDNLAKLLRDPAGISRDRLPAIIQAAAQRLAEDV